MAPGFLLSHSRQACSAGPRRGPAPTPEPPPPTAWNSDAAAGVFVTLAPVLSNENRTREHFPPRGGGGSSLSLQLGCHPHPHRGSARPCDIRAHGWQGPAGLSPQGQATSTDRTETGPNRDAGFSSLPSQGGVMPWHRQRMRGEGWGRASDSVAPGLSPTHHLAFSHLDDTGSMRGKPRAPHGTPRPPRHRGRGLPATPQGKVTAGSHHALPPNHPGGKKGASPRPLLRLHRPPPLLPWHLRGHRLYTSERTGT